MALGDSPWAGLEDSPVPPPAAAVSGERQSASSPKAEPPPAALGDSPWGELIASPVYIPPSFWDEGEDDLEPPSAATGNEYDDIPNPSAAEPLGYWGRKEQERRQRIQAREARAQKATYVSAYCR